MNKIAEQINWKDIPWPEVLFSFVYLLFFFIFLVLDGLDTVYIFPFWLFMALFFGHYLWLAYEEGELDNDLDINYSSLKNLSLPGHGLYFLARIVFFYKYWFNFLYLRSKKNRENESCINEYTDDSETEDYNKKDDYYKKINEIAKKRDFLLIINFGIECLVIWWIFQTNDNAIIVYFNAVLNLYFTWRITAILFNFLGNVFFRGEYKIILGKSARLGQDVISNSRNAIIALIGLFQIQLCFAGIWMNLGKGSGDIWERLQFSVNTSLLDTKGCNKESLLVLIHHGVVFIYTVLILVVFVSSLGGLSDKPKTGKSSNNTVK
jgi:hypothetical protein